MACCPLNPIQFGDDSADVALSLTVCPRPLSLLLLLAPGVSSGWLKVGSADDGARSSQDWQSEFCTQGTG
jgi:hypothetical protein